MSKIPERELELVEDVSVERVKGMYVYVARRVGEMNEYDGVEIRRSTRLYQWAHLYNGDIRGLNVKGLRAYFSFGVKPDRYYKDQFMRSFRVRGYEALAGK
jgi:hypothetical protein